MPVIAAVALPLFGPLGSYKVDCCRVHAGPGSLARQNTYITGARLGYHAPYVVSLLCASKQEITGIDMRRLSIVIWKEQTRSIYEDGCLLGCCAV
jgi:hypothetical protein